MGCERSTGDDASLFRLASFCRWIAFHPHWRACAAALVTAANVFFFWDDALCILLLSLLFEAESELLEFSLRMKKFLLRFCVWLMKECLFILLGESVISPESADDAVLRRPGALSPASSAASSVILFSPDDAEETLNLCAPEDDLTGDVGAKDGEAS